mgnify:FL=1
MKSEIPTTRKKKENFRDEVLNDLFADFYSRQDERRKLEKQWELDLEFLAGNQYCEISPRGEVEEEEKYYYWQNRGAFNHIAPIIDSRVAKLTKMKPIMSVKAAGAEESDVKNAKLATALVNSSYQRLSLGDVISKTTGWSESCGTGFYFVGWNPDAGKLLGEVDGKKVFEGDVVVESVSPFEIYPDSLCYENIESCESIIRARAMKTADVERLYGITVAGEDVKVFGVDKAATGKSIVHDSVLVLEKYERPTADFPDGRLIVACEKTILYMGELPYVNGVEGRRGFPFVKQNSIDKAGCFFGMSMVERLIPVQKAYNAVKNRKQEFLNRLTMGVVAVEDGSVDTDELAEEGLSPGKIIVYRQGANPPALMGTGTMPTDLNREEDRLLNEFILLSGVSEFSRSTDVAAGTSGVALQLLIEQEDARLNAVTENVRSAIRETAKQMIRLFKQFATSTRLLRTAGEQGKVELYYFNSSDLGSDDVVFDTESELSYTPAQKKSAVYELIDAGLLTDDTGKLSERTKAKLLEILGFGSIDNTLDIESLHINKADEENLSGFKKPIGVDEYDDHELHIAEHTRFLLSAESEGVRKNPETKKNALEHLRAHKTMAAENAAEQLNRS